MQRSIQISKLLLSLSLSLSLITFNGLILVAAPAGAATRKIADIPLSGVIEINGQKFTKVRDDAGKGSQFLALAKVFTPPANTQPTTDCPMNRIIGTMQTWNSCASLTTPAATAYTDIGCLVDERDGKTYEIRKFADGKCWMVDNLAYGGEVDVCVNKTSFDGCGNGSSEYECGGVGASKSGSAWGYGDCRDPSAGGACSNGDCNYCITGAGSGKCGYLYNWQAAMQHASAYYLDDYTGPTTNVQGICPSGWHLPFDEFVVLDEANGGVGFSRYCSGTPCDFWRPGYAYKGIYSGAVNSTGSLNRQGSGTLQWSAIEDSSGSALYFNVDGTYLRPIWFDDYTKHLGLSVRCIKN